MVQAICQPNFLAAYGMQVLTPRSNAYDMECYRIALYEEQSSQRRRGLEQSRYVLAQVNSLLAHNIRHIVQPSWLIQMDRSLALLLMK